MTCVSLKGLPKRRGRIQTDILGVIEKLLAWRSENARKYRNSESNLYLGRLFSLGGMFTAYFAELIAENNKDLQVLVDCPLRIVGRKQPIYPDIILIDSKKNLKGIIEAKIDFGMVGQNSVEDFCKNYKGFFNSSRCEYHIKNEWNERVETSEIRIPQSFADKNKVYMLLTSRNDHGRLPSFEKLIRDAGFNFISLLGAKDIRNGNPEENLRKARQAIESHTELERVLSPFFPS